MKNRNAHPYNPYFLVPFALWLIVGLVLHYVYGKVALFTYINGHYTPLLNEVMYRVTFMGTAQFIVPLLLLPMLLNRKLRSKWYLLLALACSVAPFLFLQLLKDLFSMPRPMHFFEHTRWVHILPHWERLFDRSFPSGHSEGAFSVFCFMAMILPYRYRAAGLLFFAAALAVGYSRVYLTAHFFEDVYAGSIVGVSATMAAYVVMDKFARKHLEQPGSA